MRLFLGAPEPIQLFVFTINVLSWKGYFELKKRIWTLKRYVDYPELEAFLELRKRCDGR